MIDIDFLLGEFDAQGRGLGLGSNAIGLVADLALPNGLHVLLVRHRREGALA